MKWESLARAETCSCQFVRVESAIRPKPMSRGCDASEGDRGKQVCSQTRKRQCQQENSRMPHSHVGIGYPAVDTIKREEGEVRTLQSQYYRNKLLLSIIEEFSNLLLHKISTQTYLSESFAHAKKPSNPTNLLKDSPA